MIIKGDSPEGRLTQVYDKDGTRIGSPISEYNTETKEAIVFVFENGRAKVGKDGKLVKETRFLEGSYAEIGGKRVK